jgi:outer membrane protein assembly factor BamB
MNIAFAFKKIMSKKEGHIEENWKYDSGSLLLSSPVIEDIDDDGNKEIVFGTKDGKIHAIDINGKLKWHYDTQAHRSEVELMFLDTEESDSVHAAPNIEDINNDKKKEIVFGTDAGKLYVLNFKGELLWSFNAEGPIRGTPAIQKFANHEIGIIFGSSDKNIYFLNAKGKLFWKYDCGSEIESCPALILGKQPLIVFGSNDGNIHALDLKGHPMWKFVTKGKMLAQPAFEVLNEGESPVILVGSSDGELYCLSEQGRMLWAYHTDGAICSRVIVADINSDGKKEIVFGSCDNNVYCLDTTGRKLWSYETDFWVVASPLAADIDNDGKMEIVAGSYDHNIYILDSEGTYILDFVPGISGIVAQTGQYGDAMTKNPGKTVGKKIWQYQTDGVIVGCAFVHGPNNIIINTDSGKINSIGHKKR